MAATGETAMWIGAFDLMTGGHYDVEDLVLVGLSTLVTIVCLIRASFSLYMVTSCRVHDFAALSGLLSSIAPKLV